MELTTGPRLDRCVVLEVDRVAARGQEVKLKKGSHVDVTIEADPDATVPRNSPPSK